MEQRYPVFVYGTLKRGCCNHKLLKGFKGIEAQAPGIELHEGPGYPYAIRGEGTTFGELYYVDLNTLKELDALESHPDYYRREKTTVILLPNNEPIDAWIYLNNEAKRWPKIKNGIWKC